MNTYEIDCPKCDDEIVFSYENDSADDGDLIAIDFPSDDDRTCKCEFTDKEKETMTNDVIERIGERERNYEPDYDY